MSDFLTSIRMRAERAGWHISGAERLLTENELETVAVELLQRALQHPRGQVDRISFTIEEIPLGLIQVAQLPDLHDNRVNSWQQGRELAREILLENGISRRAVDLALDALAAGAAPGGKSMRGAMLIDAETGERLEKDQARGVRVSRMDLTVGARRRLYRSLDRMGLNNPHVVEALTLAGKVLSAPGIVAELCWSDDPDYLAGYVATGKLGYQRINLLKPPGEELGGRAFFVNCSRANLSSLSEWLEKQPLLIDRIGRIHHPRYWQDDP